MSQIAPRIPRRFRFRFSLARLLAAITLVALLAAAWQMIFFRHPTYYLGLYEQAPSTRSGTIAVGPNRIDIEYLARNDRDGSIRYEDGLGESLPKAKSPHAQRFEDVGPWLDLVEIALAPGVDAVDVIEFRAFNHETRQLLFADDGYGWAIKSPNVVQLYGIKQPLPRKLDLWFRAQSYALPVQGFKLPATVGSECKFPDGTVRVEDLQPGNWSSAGAKLLQSVDPDAPTTTVVLSWDVSPSMSENYQIAAVSADGRCSHTELFHYISFRSGIVSAEVVRFDMPIDEVDHFVLQPFGGRHRFFFEGVVLPAISPQPLAAPPVAVIDVNGQEIERRLVDFEPIQVVVSTRRGNSFEGVSGGGSQAWVKSRAGGPIDVDDSFSVAYQVFGFSGRPTFRFFSATSKQPMSAAQLRERSTFSAGSSAAAAGGGKLRRPARRVEVD